MSTHIYDFDYEKELEKKSDNFVPLGSKKPKENTIRFSPIVVPTESKTSNIRTSPIVVPVAVKSATRVSSKRAEPPATITARKAMPVIFRQPYYNHFLNRPYTLDEIKSINKSKYDPDIEYKSNVVVEYPNKEGWDFYDEDFHGGKKRTRKARSTRRKRTRSTRSTRSKRTKKSSSRRRRSRKGR
jgi:hypothetical protein